MSLASSQLDRAGYVASHIPRAHVKVEAKDAPVTVYLYQSASGKPAAAAFVGKARKPCWRFYFNTEAEREKRIRETIDGAKRSAELRASNKSDRSKPCELKVGDILYSSWGYDQTNVDFYEVARVVSPSMVELYKIASEMTDHTQSMAGHCKAAVPVRRVGEPFRKRVQYGKSVSITSYASASLWDGKPKYCSWYA